MNSITFFLSFIPFLALILLSVNLIFAPHNSYQEKSSTFECGFHSFLGQNRTQFNISFFVFGLLFLLFDMELVLLFPAALTLAVIDIYGLILMLVFFVILTAGFAFELGKKALNIDSRQNENKINYNIQHNIFYNSTKYCIAMDLSYHYCKRCTLTSIIFIIDKYISKLNSIILFIFLIIKEYILKFNIIKLIITFTILKVLSFTLAFILYMFTIIPNFASVFTVASYLICLFIGIILIRTPLKNIPKVLITLVLNSIVIGSIITLAYSCFNIEILSSSTLAAYTYTMSQDLDNYSFIDAKSDSELPYISPVDPSHNGGPGSPGPGADPNPFPNPNSNPNPNPGPGPDPGNDAGAKALTDRADKKAANEKTRGKFDRFVDNWFHESLNSGQNTIVTRLDILNSIDGDVEIRTKDSVVLHNAISDIFKDKWPVDKGNDPVFQEIEQALKKNPGDAFKYKLGDLVKNRRILENAIKRVDT